MTARTKTKLAIIADDFTGSNDTGVQFSKKGFSSGMIVYPLEDLNAFDRYDILAVDTESRTDTLESAYQKVFDTAHMLKSSNIPHLYKKLDSTMRGNIGTELEAAIKGFGAEAAVVAPAFPGNGRIIRDGTCLVHGIPLAETEFAANPATPVISSFIPDIISAQTSLSVGLLRLESILAGIETAVGELQSLIGQGKVIIVADTETDRDLAVTAASMSELGLRIINSGSSAFAAHIADTLGVYSEQPILIVAGSKTGITRSQIDYALDKQYVTEINIDITEVLLGNVNAESERIAGLYNRRGDSPAHLLIRTAPASADVADAYKTGARLGFNFTETERRIASFLGMLARDLYGMLGCQGLILTGGDTAFEAARSLGTTNTVIGAEALPGIPKCTFLGTVHGNIPVITKAGGFGGRDAIARMIEYLVRTL